MNQTIACFDYHTHEIPQACCNVFYMGVRIIEREYDTSISCELYHNKAEKKAELTLLDFHQKDWFVNLDRRDTIVYKLSTHLKICLEQFADGN